MTEDASTALIAQLLREDYAMDLNTGQPSSTNPYLATADQFGYDYYQHQDWRSSDDEEWGRSKKKKKKAPAKVPKTVPVAKTQGYSSSTSNSTRNTSRGRPKVERVVHFDANGYEVTPRGRRVRIDKGKRRAKTEDDGAASKYNSGKFSEEEAAKFIEGTRMYGRDWEKVSEHMKTRDTRIIRSYAQKFFIQLWHKGEHLPDEVKKSGEGYTLSGKSLDPMSASVRSYLGRKMGPLPWPGVITPSDEQIEALRSPDYKTPRCIGGGSDLNGQKGKRGAKKNRSESEIASTNISTATATTTAVAIAAPLLPDTATATVGSAAAPSVSMSMSASMGMGMNNAGIISGLSSMSMPPSILTAAQMQMSGASTSASARVGSIAASGSGSQAQGQPMGIGRLDPNTNTFIPFDTVNFMQSPQPILFTSGYVNAKDGSNMGFEDLDLDKEFANKRGMGGGSVSSEEGGADQDQDQGQEQSQSQSRSAVAGADVDVTVTVDESGKLDGASVDDPSKGKKKRNKRSRKPPTSSQNQGKDQWAPQGPPTQTQYALNRPQRTRARNRVGIGLGMGMGMVGLIDMGQDGDDDASLSQIQCHSYAPAPIGARGAPPFIVEASSRAMLVADFHSHLGINEVIGFLAGHWDQQNKILRVEAAFPCRPSTAETGNVNVEMDPEYELEIRKKIAEENLDIIGWYHSHPRFTPDPSFTDLDNHVNYQRLFSDRPFIAAIFGPWDDRLPNSQSAVNWFHVPAGASPGSAWRLRVRRKEDDLSILPQVLDGFREILSDTIKVDATIPIDMSQNWRLQSVDSVAAAIRAGGGDDGTMGVSRSSGPDHRLPYDFWVAPIPVPTDEPCIKLDKVIRSLSHRLPLCISQQGADEFLESVRSDLAKESIFNLSKSISE